jgi:integrase
MARRKPTLPPGARQTSPGRISITIRLKLDDGTFTRLAHSKVKSDEPKFYATPDEAWAGYLRIQEYQKQAAAHGETLKGFWAKWSDPDHHWNLSRTDSTVMAYTARTKGFVNFRNYGDIPLSAFTERHLDAYMEDGGGLLSHIGAISRIFHDAVRRGRIATNPLARAAAEAAKLIAKQAKEKRVENPPPSVDQIEQMLARLKAPDYPDSLYGWFLTGAETGMRGGEIDGMEWEHLNGNVYWIKRQWNAKENKLTKCKAGSERRLILNPRVMAEIDKMRGNCSRYIWADSNRAHWTHNTRAYWWTWSGDGGPTLRQLVQGATMYNATRHHWASRAVNIMGLTPYQASLLYGHSDGGKLITDTYANPDHERAMREAAERALPSPDDLAKLSEEIDEFRQEQDPVKDDES